MATFHDRARPLRPRSDPEDGPTAEGSRLERFYADWVAWGEHHRAECPRCVGPAGPGCVAADDHALAVAEPYPEDEPT